MIVLLGFGFRLKSDANVTHFLNRMKLKKPPVERRLFPRFGEKRGYVLALHGEMRFEFFCDAVFFIIHDKPIIG